MSGPPVVFAGAGAPTVAPRGGWLRSGGEPSRRRRQLAMFGVALLSAAFLLLGGIGIDRYVATFWTYRGYPAPVEPAFTTLFGAPGGTRVPVVPGTVRTVEVASPALAGQSVSVTVYLPPGYRTDTGRRYPVLYLLHGFPGTPSQFIDVGDLATVADTLIAERRLQPMICVMPSGQVGNSLDSLLVDNEWANGVRAANGWETFVATDLVREIDAHYRTVGDGAHRAIGGLSEGGYGALNIGLHHVGEFGMIEAMSPYYTADRSPGLFGNRPALLAYNSPSLQLRPDAPRLRVAHTFLWFALGTGERRATTVAFVHELTSLGIPNRSVLYPGSHNWGLWRSGMPGVLTAASEYFQHGTPTR